MIGGFWECLPHNYKQKYYHLQIGFYSMLNVKIKSSIDRLWDKFWSGGISNPLTAIEQISYLLFMKRLDQMDLKKKQDGAFTGESYKSIFAGKDEDLRWSNFVNMEGGEMLNHIQLKVFPFL